MSHIAGPSPDAPATIPSQAAKDPGVGERARAEQVTDGREHVRARSRRVELFACELGQRVLFACTNA